MYRFALAMAVGAAFAAAGCRDGAAGRDLRAVVSCRPDRGARVNKDIPVCRNRNDIERLDGRKVLLLGTYGQIDVRQRRKPAPTYSGHVAITLEDSTFVLLEPVWKAEANGMCFMQAGDLAQF